jgi:hypothetical protein
MAFILILILDLDFVEGQTGRSKALVILHGLLFLKGGNMCVSDEWKGVLS